MNAKDPAAVYVVQRDLVTQQLEGVPRIDARNPGLTLAIAKDNLEAIAKSLPGLQANDGKIELDDLLAEWSHRSLSGCLAGPGRCRGGSGDSPG